MKEETALELLRIAAGLAQTALDHAATKAPLRQGGGLDIAVVYADCVKAAHEQYQALLAQQETEAG